MEGKLRRGEVRRLHIIYFLSHMGRAEHPHLVRVHHLTRTGVYLRDVKRWLGELRGKDMPEAYAWSYKRRYKSGYVWQDLVDDDLITPLSDNEYVLKGSEIIFSSSDEKADIARHSCSSTTAGKENNSNSTMNPNNNNNLKAPVDREEDKLERQDSKNDPPSRIFSEINEEESSSFGSERSSLTDEFELVKSEAQSLEEKDNLCRKKTPTTKANKCEAVCSDPLSPAKSWKSFSSNTLRSFITCGGLDTNDAVLVSLNRRGQGNSCEVVKGDQLVRSSRAFGSFRDHSEEEVRQSRTSTRRSFDDGKRSKKHQQQSEFTTKQKSTIPTVYRPVKQPNCSQCGKSFKPQKMHSHMKSCKGMKTSKSPICCASFEKSSVSDPKHGGSMNSIYKESSFGYLLPN